MLGKTLNEHNYQCPHCGAFDRVRLIVLFLDETIGSLPPDHRVRLLTVTDGSVLYVVRKPAFSRQ